MSGFRRERTLGEGGDEILVVTDLATLRIVSEPTRLRLLELLHDGPTTVKELAAALGVPPTRLYYHMKLLEDHGIVRVESTRIVSGIVEKTYAATASRLSLDRSVLSPGTTPREESVEALLAFVVDGARAEIRRGVARGRIDPLNKSAAAGGLTLGRDWFVLTPERMEAFLRRFDELEEEFGARERPPEGEPGAVTYELLLGVYPVESRGSGDGEGQSDAGA
jgi:DNA-binding transcriptional ArsR family regulator